MRTCIVICAIVLCLSVPCHSQVRFVPLSLAAKPGSPASPTCIQAYTLIKPVVFQFPHPESWQFIIACTDRDWLELTRHLGFSHPGKYTLALTDQKAKITYVRAEAILQTVGPGWGPDRIMAHELAHIFLHSDDEQQVDDQAVKWIKDGKLVQIAGGVQ